LHKTSSWLFWRPPQIGPLGPLRFLLKTEISLHVNLLRQICNDPPGDPNLVIISYSVFDFDPNMSAFFRMTDVLVVNLDGIDWLDKISLSAVYVNHVTQIDLAINQFDDPDIYSRIIVNNPTDNGFSYTNSHN
jgi:hypothetical protein